MGPYLLDTGILLRLLDSDDPLHKDVRKAVGVLRNRREKFCTTFQNVCEFWNVTTRPASARGGLGFDVVSAERRAGLIVRWCPLINDSPDVYPVWYRLATTYQVSGTAVHDARLTATMLFNGVTQIVTLNERHFRRYEPEGITIVTPQSILASPA
jgi:predicted nucleic acid-binding protein